MYSLKDIPSTASVLSTYTAFTASAMLIRSVISEVQAITGQLIPKQLKDLLLSKLCSKPSSQMILLINENDGICINELYEASITYLQTKITASMERLNVSKAPRDSKVTYVIERSKAIKEENKVVKLLSFENLYHGDDEGPWGSTNLDHPATFDKLAMDPSVKKELIDDLDRFVRRREYYKRVGKAWKRGYLLYGPPGTGKSSLIAAMANYLQFDVYDLELTNIYSNSDLRRWLLSTRNRSMIVIEDIDCSIELQNRQEVEQGTNSNNKLTLSGLLNFIDGLWSSCGDERIIVFTTNHKDRLDPALLRPGRMDMHIHMSYCTPSGFRVLASNYLSITEHNLFDEIDELVMEVEVTPAEVAEEIMKSEDGDVALEGLVKFLRDKKLRSEN